MSRHRGVVDVQTNAERGPPALTPRKSAVDGPQDPRRRKVAAAPSARLAGKVPSDEESLPSAPSPGGIANDAKTRRVLVARQDPRRAILRPQRDDRPRLTPASALVLKSNTEVTERRKEPKTHAKVRGLDTVKERSEAGKLRHEADANSQRRRTSKKQGGTPKSEQKESQVSQTARRKRHESSEDKAVSKVVSKRNKVEGLDKQSEKEKRSEKKGKGLTRKHAEEAVESKQKKDKDSKSNKTKKKAKEKEKMSEEETKPRKPDKERSSPTGTKPRSRREKKQKYESEGTAEERPAPQRSSNLPKATPEFQPSPKPGPLRHPTAGADDRQSRKASTKHRQEQLVTTVGTSKDGRQRDRDRRDRQRRQHRSRSRSRRRRAEREAAMRPEAWQVWRAGSYHPWSAQLAGTPLSALWPVPSVPGAMMGQAWAVGSIPAQSPTMTQAMPHAKGGVAPDSDSSDEDDEEDNEDSEEEDEEEEEEADDEQTAVKDVETVVPVPEPKPLAGNATPAAAIESSESADSAEDEESETESHDEDAEIGEAPVLQRTANGIAQAEVPSPPAVRSDLPQAPRWQPPGLPRPRAPLHRSVERWPGPSKVGWAELYELDLDLNLVKGSSQSSFATCLERSQGAGVGLTDGDASEVEELEQANPSEAPQAETAGPVRPLIIPHWNNTRAWAGPQEVILDEPHTWQPRQLCSSVLRSRRKGRSLGGSAIGANPQEPPDSADDAGGSTLLLTIGAVARAVRLMQWRVPPLLDLLEGLKVDPSKYRGSERTQRQRKRPAAKAKKAAAVKSMPGGVPAKAASEEYNSKLRALMQKVQDGSSERQAVRDFWSDLTPGDRVQFSTEFPQFMHLVVGLPSSIPTKAAAPPPPLTKTTPPAKSAAVCAVASAAASSCAVASVGLPATCPKVSAPALSAEVLKKQQSSWADRLTFHDGILRANMSSLQMNDAALVSWCQWAPALLRTLGSAGGAPLSNADLNFSGNAIEDAGLRQLLATLQGCDVHVRSLNLNANRLTEASLVAISDLISKSRLPISAILMEHNRVQGSYGLMNLARALKGNAQYPMFREETKRYTPLMLHLAGNMIERPMHVTQLVKEAFDNRFPSTSEERQYWEAKQQCPPLQLPAFEKQEASSWQ